MESILKVYERMMIMGKKDEKEKDVFGAYYGDKAFVKIRQAFDINKIKLSFVDKSNPKQHVDCYMDVEEFGALLMNKIKDRTLLNAIATEKSKGEQYPKAVWRSPLGGENNNGSPISRYFEIGPASKYEVLFTAYVYPAEINATGAYIKIKGAQPTTVLRVPCTYNDLLILQYKWSFIEYNYMSQKYSLENMKSSYRSDNQATEQAEKVAPAYSEPQDVNESVDEEVPFVSSDNVTPQSKPAQEKVAKVNKKLTAVSALTQIPDKRVKVCKVFDGEEVRPMYCLLDKITDKNFDVFEARLASLAEKNETLDFTANVSESKGMLYLIDEVKCVDTKSA